MAGMASSTSAPAGVEGAAPGPRIAYVSDMRVPTDKAHGIHVMKMCEALAGQGARVVLYVPARVQSADMKGVDPFAYYGLRRHFPIRRLAHLDPHPSQRWAPPPLRRAVFVLSNLLLGLTAGVRVAASRPDLAVTRHWATAWCLTLLRTPTVLEVHQLFTPSSSGRVARVLRAMSRRRSLRALVVISGSLREALAGMVVPDERLLLLPDAVDPPREGLDVGRAEARQALGLPGETWIVGYTGQLFASKGVEVLLDAASRMPDALVLFVGGAADDRERLSRLAEARGARNVRFAGHVEPARARLYQVACDVLVLPQIDLTAQSPMKLYEYMAARRPIVASDLEPIREVLAHERNALLVPAMDAAELARAVMRLRVDAALGERLAAAAAEQARSATWDNRA
ncbi:MAG: glycosyltransferase family 4 protein, partial [SAR202 cluster bacterium]|nr:glycosyltransferase family 4 protein [SAR202 cluster bacterium]